MLAFGLVVLVIFFWREKVLFYFVIFWGFSIDVRTYCLAHRLRNSLQIPSVTWLRVVDGRSFHKSLFLSLFAEVLLLPIQLKSRERDDPPLCLALLVCLFAVDTTTRIYTVDIVYPRSSKRFGFSSALWVCVFLLSDCLRARFTAAISRLSFGRFRTALFPRRIELFPHFQNNIVYNIGSGLSQIWELLHLWWMNCVLVQQLLRPKQFQTYTYIG